jgi:hypothetical protein
LILPRLFRTSLSISVSFSHYVFVSCFVLTTTIVKKQVTIATSALDACSKAEAIVIATEWKEFREIPWETVYAQMNKPAFVFDGRLLVDSDALHKIGFTVCLFSLPWVQRSRLIDEYTGYYHRPWRAPVRCMIPSELICGWRICCLGMGSLCCVVGFSKQNAYIVDIH